MLYLARSLSQLHFGSLMAVYADANRENGREAWPEEPEMRQIQLAEEEFYRYLSQVFFKTPGAICAVWEENGTVRQRPALGAVPGRASAGSAGNRPGAATKGLCRGLIEAVQTYLGEGGKLYSHVDKRNLPSLKTHEKCGFRRIADIAVYVDGSGEPEGLHHVLG